MKKKNRTAITIETRRLLIIRSSKQEILRGWCEPCHAQSHLLTVEYAEFVSGLTQRQLFRAVENGRVHFSEIAGRPLVCLDSLGDLMPQTEELVSKSLTMTGWHQRDEGDYRDEDRKTSA